MTASEPRLSEAAELYEELGFEVLLQPFVASDREDSCSRCMATNGESFWTIYTRSRRDG